MSAAARNERGLEIETRSRRVRAGRGLEFRILLPLFLVALAGCRGDGLEDLARISEESSLQRLAALPTDARVLVSFEGFAALSEAPDPGPDGKSLASFDKTHLLAVTRERLLELAVHPEAKALLVWGDARLAERLDARLRLTLLSRVSGGELRATPLDVVARFEGDVLDLRHRLEKLGAEPRSVNAGVVTMSAPIDVLLEVLALPDLVKLSKPVRQQPLQTLR